eukprot:scaffold18596_cov126-Isochrysis_galbana.AAC.1
MIGRAPGETTGLGLRLPCACAKGFEAAGWEYDPQGHPDHRRVLVCFNLGDPGAPLSGPGDRPALCLSFEHTSRQENILGDECQLKIMRWNFSNVAP